MELFEQFLLGRLIYASRQLALIQFLVITLVTITPAFPFLSLVGVSHSHLSLPSLLL